MEARQETGFVAEVTSSHYFVQQSEVSWLPNCAFHIDYILYLHKKKSDFIDQINKSGGGGLTLLLQDSELTDFCHFLCKSFDFEDASTCKVGASFIGLQ